MGIVGGIASGVLGGGKGGGIVGDGSGFTGGGSSATSGTNVINVNGGGGLADIGQLLQAINGPSENGGFTPEQTMGGLSRPVSISPMLILLGVVVLVFLLRK